MRTLTQERQADWDVAWRYLVEVDAALEKLAAHPDLGWRRNFHHPELRNLRCWLIARPFHRHLIFYRHDQHTLEAVRVMHGGRDLARRLVQGGTSAQVTRPVGAARRRTWAKCQGHWSWHPKVPFP